MVGNQGVTNRVYINNGTAAPFNDVSGTDASVDTGATYSIALGDVNGDGDVDLVTGDYGQTNKLYLGNGNGTFAAGSQVSADTHNTRSVVLGDMDGDGDLDIVSGNTSAANYLYLNNGTVTPFPSVTGSGVTSDNANTFAAAVGDVDADGDLDAVMGNAFANTLCPNNGTAVPFAGVSSSDVTSDSVTTLSIALGDLDGDGDLDLVTGTNGVANRLYLNVATPSPLGAMAGTDVTSAAYLTYSMAVGDVNGDGNVDFVVGNGAGSASQRNQIYTNDGAGGFVGADVLTDQNWTSAVELADMDGDGSLDLLVGNSGTNTLYLNNGSGSFAAGTSISGDATATFAMAVGDLNGDGRLDVVTGEYNLANRVYLNNGTAAPFNLVTGANLTADAHWTYSMVLGDVDGDNDLDVVAGNWGQANRLYLNNGDGTFAAGSDITTDAANTTSLALADMDGDGDLDLVVGNSNSVNRLYLNDGTASPFGGVTGSDITSDSQNTRSVAIVDLDHDGDLDMVAGNLAGTNRVYVNNGTLDPFGGATGYDVTSDAHDTYAISVADVDGDGDLDLIAGNAYEAGRLYLNAGSTLSFAEPTGTNITGDSGNTQSFAAGDVDGDGDLDLVAGHWSGRNRLYKNNGTATPFSGITGSDITTDSHVTRVVVLGDLDNDGDLDLVAGNWNQADRVYLNDGTSSPYSGITGTDVSVEAGSTTCLALGDVDGDGDLDLVAGMRLGVNRLYLNNGDGTFAAGSDITTDDLTTRGVALGDLDGDGDLDLATASDGGNLCKLYINNGSGTFAGGSTFGSGTWPATAIALGDVDGDGDLDVVTGNYGVANRHYLNTGSGTISGGGQIAPDADNTLAIALADVDDDGDLDVVASNYSTTVNRLHLNNGTATPFSGGTGADISSDADDSRGLAVEDFDGDGRSDVAIANSGVNRLYIRRALYSATAGSAASLEVDAIADIPWARITPTQTTPTGTSVAWYLSNNGGVKWHSVSPNEWFTFPAAGGDLRWRAELSTLSPAETPEVTQVLVEVDLTGPTFSSISAAPDPAATGASVTITFTASEDLGANPTVTVDGFAASFDSVSGLDYTYTYSVSGSELEGTVAIAVSGADVLGNAGASSGSMDIDDTGPTYSAISATPDPAASGATIAVTFTASETLASNPSVTVDGNGATFVSVTGLDYAYDYAVQSTETEAAVTISISGDDLAGNAGADSSATVTLDFTPPGAPTVSGPVQTTDATPTWTWTEGGGGNGTFRWQIDAEFPGGWTEGATLSHAPASKLTVDIHTLYVQERDDAGNWSTSGSFDTIVDSPPPPSGDGGGCTPGVGHPGLLVLLAAAVLGTLGRCRRKR